MSDGVARATEQERHATARAGLQGPAVEGGAAGQVTVAVVDDDASVLALVSSVLQGYRVMAYDRPQHALEALAQGLRPDLIVSDVTMPGMSGFELHEAVREVAPLRSVPFIYLTAMSDRDHVRRGMALGADDYLTKPFTPGELRDAVRVRLERAGVLRTAADGELAVTSLGGLGVSFGAQRLHWEARKVVELLLFLLENGGAADAHAIRAELWWQAAADNHLHVLVSRLRKTLAGVGGVSVEGDRLRLELEARVRWDARAFEEAAGAALQGGDAAAVEQALRGYGGAFLADFDSPWAERRRAELEERYLALLEAAVERADGDAEIQRAQDRLDAFLDLDG